MAGRSGKKVTVKRITAQRARDGAIRTDHTKVKSELFHDGEREGVPAPGNHDNFNSLSLRPPQSCQIGARNMEFGVEQGAVDIDGNEADRIGRHTQF